jgi:hypothetical protein
LRRRLVRPLGRRKPLDRAPPTPRAAGRRARRHHHHSEAVQAFLYAGDPGQSVRPTRRVERGPLPRGALMSPPQSETRRRSSPPYRRPGG